MKLFINNFCHGVVSIYYQNRIEKSWVFELQNGCCIVVPFDKIKVFNSSGILEIIL